MTRWERLCWACLGEKCDVCGDRGWILESVPPEQLLTEDAGELWEGYRFLRDYGIFPVPGGLVNQAARFLSTIRLCDRVNGVYVAYMRKKMEAIEKAQAELDRMTGQ